MHRPTAIRVGLLLGASIAIAICYFILSFATLKHSYARDLGQWENTDPEIRLWYQTLQRPDGKGICCTEADAYYADDVHVRDGKAYAVITDSRPDEPLGRPHIAVGTEFEIPPEKLKFDRGNPTGHNVLFVSVAGQVWCFVQGFGT